MMQIALPFRDGPPAAGEPRPVRVNGRVELVRFVRVKRARRYLLRVGTDGRLRVTLPPGGSLSEATAFVRKQADWIAREQARALRAAMAALPAKEAAILRAQAEAELPQRLRELAKQHGFLVSPALTRRRHYRLPRTGSARGNACFGDLSAEALGPPRPQRGFRPLRGAFRLRGVLAVLHTFAEPTVPSASHAGAARRPLPCRPSPFPGGRSPSPRQQRRVHVQTSAGLPPGSLILRWLDREITRCLSVLL
jgi:hypothetical protein